MLEVIEIFREGRVTGKSYRSPGSHPRITDRPGARSYRGAVIVPRRSPTRQHSVSRGLVVGLVVLSVAAALVSIAALELLHPALSWNRDEPVYLWHIDVLASGRLTGPGGTPIEAFRPWLGGIRDQAYFSQYTLGWPLVLLASDLVLGSPEGAVVAGTVLAVVGAVLLTRELTGREDLALAAGAAFLVTPAVVIQSGTHLGYLFTIGLGNLALTAGFAGLRRQRPAWLVVAGLLLGWVLLTRPFDAVLWGTVLLVGGALHHRWQVVRRGWPVAVAAAPFVVATVAYNLRITGEPFTFPIVAADPLDTFGLGRRRLMPTFDPVNYHVGRAAYSTLKNAGFFALFVAGNVATVVLAGLGAWWRRRRPETWVLVLLGAVFPVGYSFFWGTYISSLTARLVGSIYHLPAVVPLVVLAGFGFLELRRRARRTAVVLVVAAVVLTVPVAISRFDVNRRISLAQEPWAESVEHLPDDSLVIVADSGDYLFFQNPESRNGPTLDDEVLYAVDLGAGNFATLAAHPERTPYLQVADLDSEEMGPRESPVVPTVEVVPIEMRTGTTLSVRATYRPLDGAPVVVPYVEVAGRRTWGRASDVSLAEDGGAIASFTFGAGGVDVPDEATVLRFGFGAGADAVEATTSPRIRWAAAVDGSGGGLTALLPFQQEVRFPVGRDFKWYPRPAYPGASANVDVGG